MKFTYRQAFLWTALYIIFAVAPLMVSYVGPVGEPRGFWIELAVGLGFIGLSLMGLQFVLTGRFRTIAGTLGLDLMLQFHRQAGIISFCFIYAHAFILLICEPQYLSFLDPRVNLPRALALSSVLGGLMLITATSLWRQKLGLNYEFWRTVHALLAFFIVFIGLVHILQVGFYVSVLWKQVLWITLTATALFLLVKTRLINPYLSYRKPYKVVEVRDEKGKAWTLALKPLGHKCMEFDSGQFAWLTLGDSPFSLQQHPFSISSSAENRESIEFTIKSAGDFTSTIGDIVPGTKAYVEGPYGAFTPGKDPSDTVFIAGGVGITPVMSMLRTFRDRNDRRRILLVYGTRSVDNALFSDEIRQLSHTLYLTVVHVVEEPPPSWNGETGYITGDIIEKHAAGFRQHGTKFFVCGPEPMMDMAELYLYRTGIPLKNIFSERFSIV